MNLDSYEYVSGKTLFDFEFESVGPNGKIRKGIRYSLRNVLGRTYFNVSFGDINPETDEIDYFTVSNNFDVNKILVTIARNILDFSAKFPDMPYLVKGSTKARTRLYQIGISKNIVEIEKLFDLYGEYNNRLESFTTGRNYEAFFFYRK